jgi:hypothetical protein
MLRSSNFERSDLKAERAGNCLNLPHLQHDGGIVDIGHDRQSAKTRNDVA